MTGAPAGPRGCRYEVGRASSEAPVSRTRPPTGWGAARTATSSKRAWSRGA